MYATIKAHRRIMILELAACGPLTHAELHKACETHLPGYAWSQAAAALEEMRFVYEIEFDKDNYSFDLTTIWYDDKGMFKEDRLED